MTVLKHDPNEGKTKAQLASEERARLRKEQYAAKAAEKAETKSAKPSPKTAKKEVKAPDKKADITAPKAKTKASGPVEKHALTPRLYGEFQRAFDAINGHFFEARLPPVVLTLAVKPRSKGYFAPELWKSEKEKAHEISLNPTLMRVRTDKDVLSTLLHECCHLEQEVDNAAPKHVYHNKDFADRMERVGLICSSTGEPGGKKTGVSMTHYISKGGAFDKWADEFVGAGFSFEWSAVAHEDEKPKGKSGSRTKYVCPECEAKVWGKDGLNIHCGDCDVEMRADGVNAGTEHEGDEDEDGN